MSAATVPVEHVVRPRRRTAELLLDLFALALGLAGWALSHLNGTGTIPPNWPWVVGLWCGMGLVMHLLIRWRLPWADPALLPCALLLNGLGLAMIDRLDRVAAIGPAGAGMQMVWTALGMACCAAVVVGLRDHRRLQRFPYLLALLGIVLLLMPLLPGIGRSINGARVWIHLGPFSLQPSEIAKILLALAFASYLEEHRAVLALAGRHVLGLALPRLRDLGPIVVMWGAAMAVFVFQNDFGMALLFFGLFVMMLYVATERPGWPVLGALMLVVGGYGAYTTARHIRVRVNAWLHPFDNYDQNYQVIQAQFGLAWGGLTGRGWGLGRPWMTPLAKSDFIAAALGEEIGTIGLMAVVMVYALIVARALRTALASHDAFGKLLASGLGFVVALQVFAIIGGVTRLLPLTGLTTPFMSQGGSSMLSNWVILGILLVLSHQARRPPVRVAANPDALADDDTMVIPVTKDMP